MSYYNNSYSNASNHSGSDSEDEIPFDKKPSDFNFADRGVDDEGLGSVIRVMNQLYDVEQRLKLEGHEIKLPQIVVCGSQSSGKTSVLESISREEFLPRGTDIQTRCPIVLQLINTNQKRKWVEFVHGKEKQYTNMEEVKRMIEKVNSKIIKNHQIVSEDSITLKLYSPNVPNITLVDLPGLIENPMEGQPDNLVTKINELVYKYISNENCIILAITAATNDIADSKAISLSRKVDPHGKRTLGVLTKLDLMDDGTNANDVLMGRKIKLDLGIVGVVNRSYLEVQQKKSLHDQLQKEKDFLMEHYPSLAATNGIPFLIKRISALLMKSIKRTLPGIKDTVDIMIEEYKQTLDDLGEPEEVEDKGTILLRLLTRFVESYCAQVDGRRRNMELSSLNASAKIKKLFDMLLGEEFERLVAATKLTDKEIDIAIQNSHALHSRHIDYDDAFQELAKRELKKLSPFVQKCTKEVCKEMRNAVDTSIDAITKNQYPKLFQKMKLVALELINERFKDCQKYLEDYLNAEASIARTIKGGFRDKNGGHLSSDMDNLEETSSNASSNGMSNSSEQQYTYVNEDTKPVRKDDKKKKAADGEVYDSNSFEGAATHRVNVKRDVQRYFDGAKRQIMEHVARGIVYKLVYGTSNKMTEYMLKHLHTVESANELVVDRHEDEIQERRKEAQSRLIEYEEASNVIEIILNHDANLS